ncbi:amino acid ABC transporter permease [Burkholderiaceae bacterium DAT-1]|nr:amino acid ABC transporter permease [Burkholderiaceae bacterium DAT-1]
MSFDLSLILAAPYRDWLMDGVLMSLKLTAMSLALALPLAALLASAQISPWKWAGRVARGYVGIVRNIPLLVHILFWYFAVPELLPEPVKLALYQHDVEPLAAIAALTLYTAAYMSEDMRSGIQSVGARQLETARAFGFSYPAAMRYVVLPQAVRLVLPALLSQTINLWKNSSIATVIGVAELMNQAARVETTLFRSAEVFALATAIYAGVALLLTFFARLLQQRYPAYAA